MIILIDAYNLLKQLYVTDLIADRERDAYIAILNRYSKVKKHSIILLFDGGFFDMPSRVKEGRVTVVYPGRNHSADEAIKVYLKENHVKEILLVTADRELIDFAQRLDVVAIDPITFDRYVQQATASPDKRIKKAKSGLKKLHSTEGSQELDALMEHASLQVIEKQEDENDMRYQSGSVVSKKERKLMAKLDKL